MTRPLPDLLPPNAQPVDRALDAAAARVSAIPTPLAEQWNPATCPIENLPYLAWALSIDAWDPDWPENVKRQRVAVAIAVQRSKGSALSVETVVKSFGGSVILREWWQTTPRGTPHTFSMVLNVTDGSGNPRDAGFVDAMVAEVSRTKPLRSHFTFTQGLQAMAGIGIRGVARFNSFRRLALTTAA